MWLGSGQLLLRGRRSPLGTAQEVGCPGLHLPSLLLWAQLGSLSARPPRAVRAPAGGGQLEGAAGVGGAGPGRAREGGGNEPRREALRLSAGRARAGRVFNAHHVSAGHVT